MTDTEAAIRERAHAIWEAEGRPHGRDALHWQQATLEVEQARAEAQAELVSAPAAPAKRSRAKAPAGEAAPVAKPRATRRKG